VSGYLVPNRQASLRFSTSWVKGHRVKAKILICCKVLYIRFRVNVLTQDSVRRGFVLLHGALVTLILLHIGLGGYLNCWLETCYLLM